MAGRTRQIGQEFTRELKDTETLEDDCLVLMIEASGKVAKCNSTARPYAIARQSTQNRVSNTIGVTRYDEGSNLGEIAMFRSGWAKVPVANNNAAGAIGDMVIVSGDGKINKGNPATTLEYNRRVGWLEEALPAGTQNGPGKKEIRVALDIRGGSP